MKKHYFILFYFILAINIAYGQEVRSITNLLWGRTDSISTGIKMFYVDSLVKAHVTYYDVQHNINHITLNFEISENNQYVFRTHDNRHDYWLIISADDSISLKASFMITRLVPDTLGYKNLLNWKLMTGEKSKGLDELLNDNNVIRDEVFSTDPGFLKNLVCNFNNISCCTNHKTKHCASTLEDMAKLSKQTGCVF